MFFLIILIGFIKPFYGFDFLISSLLLIAIMVSVKQSGAHYNPSMSFSNFFIKFSPVKFDPHFMWTYFKAEFVPAFIAYNVAYYMKGYYYPPKPSNSLY
jgi:glycerol uptake facilitator-like aquaporin